MSTEDLRAIKTYLERLQGHYQARAAAADHRHDKAEVASYTKYVNELEALQHRIGAEIARRELRG